MLKLIPTILGILTAASPVIAPFVGDFLAQHPSVGLVVLGLYSVLAHLLPSPVPPAPKP